MNGTHSHAEAHHHDGHHPADADELLLRGVRLELLVDVEGHERRGRVERGRERRHQRRHQRRDHEPDEAGRQEPDDQRRIRRVAADVGIERPGDEAGQHEHEDRQNLQETAEERAAARVRLVLRPEHALHDHLIRAPVPDAEDGRAEEDAGPRERRVRRRLDHVEVVRRQRRAQPGHPTDLAEPDDRERGRAEQQHHRLQQLRVDDRRQPAEHGVDPGRHDHHRRRGDRNPSRAPPAARAPRHRATPRSS